MRTSDALIIGAGPYGVSISAHLRKAGVDHRIVGRFMDTWRAHMPVGMNLKSEPYASGMASPGQGNDVLTYSRLHNLDDARRTGPLSLERFLSYSDWYSARLVPDIEDLTVTGVKPVSGGFEVTFADAEPMLARQVVIATGILPYARTPEELSELPEDLASHASDHHQLDRFHGRRVAVVGAGQSALETAALLHEAGADVHIIVRGTNVSWVDPNPESLGALGRIRRPATNLCEGWRCAFWNNPTAFRRLPEQMRVTKARTVLGPSGSWWLKDRVDGVIDILTSHRVTGAVPEGSGVRLQLDGAKQSSIDVDHVMAGTGFRIDLARLPFLQDELRARIGTVDGYPVVSRTAESSVPGLYFVGAPTAASLGPSARFIAGTHNISARLSRRLASGRKASGGRPASQEQDRMSV